MICQTLFGKWILRWDVVCEMKTYRIDLNPEEVDCLSICLDTLNPSCIEDAVMQGVILQILEQSEDNVHS